jgi:hypothetical protein
MKEKRTAPAWSAYIPSKPEEVPVMKWWRWVFICSAATKGRHTYSFHFNVGWGKISDFERGEGRHKPAEIFEFWKEEWNISRHCWMFDRRTVYETRSSNP